MAAWPSRSPRHASWSAALTLGTAALAATAYAVAPPLVPPEQVAGAGKDIAVDQLGGQGDAIVSAPSLPAIDLSTDQLSPKVGDPGILQLQQAERRARDIAAVSTTAQSTPQPAKAIGGTDRCDPERAGKGKPSVCRNPVEARAGEFERPAPEVPLQRVEKKLLGGRVSPAAEVVARDASMGTAGSNASVDDSATQALASIVLAPPTPAAPASAEAGADDKALSDPAAIGILLPPVVKP